MVHGHQCRLSGIDAFEIFHKENVKDPHNLRYVCSINNLRIFVEKGSKKAVLFSRQMISQINYAVMHDPDQLVDIEFETIENLRESTVKLTYAQQIIWAGYETVVFEFPFN